MITLEKADIYYKLFNITTTIKNNQIIQDKETSRQEQNINNDIKELNKKYKI